MIDFEKFSKPIKVTVPIINNKFKYKGKEYSVKSENGWVEIEILGNSCKVLFQSGPCYCESKNFIKGYIYGDNFIPFNFDEGKRKIGKEVMNQIYLNNCDSFSSIIALIWEDGKLFYYDSNYKDSFIYTVKNLIESGKNLNIKGITPELRTLCLFYELEKQRLIKLKKEQASEELRKTLEGRLILSFCRVGAELLDYSITGKCIITNWKLNGEDFNSVLDKDTFKVLEAGYCLSGHDKDHTVHSIVNLAKDYIDNDLIYKTRET